MNKRNYKYLLPVGTAVFMSAGAGIGWLIDEKCLQGVPFSDLLENHFQITQAIFFLWII